MIIVKKEPLKESKKLAESNLSQDLNMDVSRLLIKVHSLLHNKPPQHLSIEEASITTSLMAINSVLYWVDHLYEYDRKNTVLRDKVQKIGMALRGALHTIERLF
jgi:hypothetical protein